jgi:hypothetical protein
MASVSVSGVALLGKTTAVGSHIDLRERLAYLEGVLSGLENTGVVLPTGDYETLYKTLKDTKEFLYE